MSSVSKTSENLISSALTAKATSSLINPVKSKSKLSSEEVFSLTMFFLYLFSKSKDTLSNFDSDSLSISTFSWLSIETLSASSTNDLIDFLSGKN